MKFLFQLIVLLTTVVSVNAQIKLTYDEAVKVALQKNIELNAQQNEVQRAVAQRTQSIIGIGPRLELNADLYDRRGRQQIQNPETQTVEFVDVVSNNLSMRLDASIPLFNGFNRIQTFTSRHSGVKAQEFALERSKQNTIFNVSQQYLQVLLSEELYRIAQDNFRNQSENLKRIEGQVEVGALAPIDQYNQLAQVKRLESLMITAKNTFENDKLILAQTLQLEPGTDYTLEKPGHSLEETLQLQVDMDELYKIALSQRPDYNQQQQLVLQNNRNVNALRGSYLPTLSAFYTYGTFYNSTIPIDRKEQLTNVSPYHFYGLTLSVPILTGFTTRSRVQMAKIDRENSVLQENNLKTIIYRDVKTAHQNFEASKANYLSAVAQFEAASEAYNLEKERYELGLSAFFEFSNASNALIQAQAAKAQAEFTLMFQETILNYQVGQLKYQDQ
jgi:outer membrane protein